MADRVRHQCIQGSRGESVRGTRLSQNLQRGSSRAGLVLLLIISATGCDRPFVPPAPPEVSLLSPPVDEVTGRPESEFVVEVSSYRDIVRVTLNGTEMTRFDVRFEERNQISRWTSRGVLGDGLNPIAIRAEDVEGVVGTDTAYVPYVWLRPQIGAALPFVEARGGHSATTLNTGNILVVGGARSSTAPASDDAFLVSSTGTSITKLPGQLRHARAGHTATLLPDGRVLILGGSSSDEIITFAEGISGFVEPAEVYDPSEDLFSEVPVVTDFPIRRAGHTTILLSPSSSTPQLLLFGGSGDLRYGANPRWGIRDEVRRFVFRDDTLFASGSRFGIPVEPISGHVTVPLEVDNDGFGRYVNWGSFFPPNSSDIDLVDDVAIELRFAGDGLEERPLPRFRESRTRHAATSLAGGLVAIIGGRQFRTSSGLSSMELYVDAARRIYPFPPTSSLLQERWAHTATKLANGRILVLGGFSAGGFASKTTEILESNIQ